MLKIREEQYSALNMVAVLQDVWIFVGHARDHHDTVTSTRDLIVAIEASALGSDLSA